jgi:hypothetical protein
MLNWLFPAVAEREADPCRARCKARIAGCAAVLIGTKRMVGRVIASQISSASRASFLFVFTYGRTNCGAINLTLWPKPCKRRAQLWLLLPASMPIAQAGSFVKYSTTSLRRSCLRPTTLPCACYPIWGGISPRPSSGVSLLLFQCNLDPVYTQLKFQSLGGPDQIEHHPILIP